jgi:transcriptional regulator with XRE-family HTH domain
MIFKTLRINYSLTRSQLAEAIGRSTNYIMKAEQASFPAPSQALLDFYTRRTPPTPTNWARSPTGLSGSDSTFAGLSGSEGSLDGRVYFNNGVEWVQQDAEVLTSAYYEDQKRARLTFLDKWTPYASGVQFKDCWQLPMYDYVLKPTEYALSTELCVPAAAVFELHRAGKLSGAIQAAVNDLLEFSASGQCKPEALADLLALKARLTNGWE